MPVLTIVFLCCLAATSVEAETLTVSQNGTGDFISVREAYVAAEAGDIIEVGPGIYVEGLKIDKSITLLGAGADKTILGFPIGAISINAENVIIEGFHLQGGYDLTLGATVSFLSGSGILRRNIISGGHFSINATSDEAQITANYNDLQGKVGIRILNSSTVDARFNWWGTQKEEEILQKIELEGGAQIDFSLWLFSPDDIQPLGTLVIEHTLGKIKQRVIGSTKG